MTRVAIVASAVCSVAVPMAQAGGDHKVLLCHATSSATNPYELISIDTHGAAGHLAAGHGDSEHTDFLLGDDTDCLGDPGEE